MKKSLLYLMMLVAGMCYSQTTMEEYLYITQGYADHLSKGQDTNKDYLIVDKGSYPVNTKEGNATVLREVTCYAFTLEETNKIKGFLFIFSREDTNYKEYFCVPVSSTPPPLKSKAVQDFYDKSLKAGYSASAISYLWSTMNLLANHIESSQ